ncbi:hypothetical protein [Lentzea sp. NPDC003310]|uniref:hypothetical protein n=1 Tax=Lentzea sp. NPDC003310 TaxID=3154447 RepID=UPI0033A35686
MIVARHQVLDPAAREALADQGAVILTGLPNSPSSLPVAAALLFGTALRELYPHRTRRSVDGGIVGPHADSFDVVVDIAGKTVRRRHIPMRTTSWCCSRPRPRTEVSPSCSTRTSSPTRWTRS